ncbi:hypothetical protein ASF69_17005 [Rhizobium sp. Leaf311]|uniref:GNAT family N-acetyltransferase n=1 Tax=Rhizobium sp. Leaf311 TaxID=1736332 RepID=UPI000713AFDE|nr:GNAT family N-acetyltransferase [Rhizobium sp. Leaf311]KQQ56455.1 hypothetical protein ASF69_17005 [Rhizobium sp. Leaf311]
MGQIRIVPLSEHPHYVAPLVEMLHTEWGSLSNWSDPVALQTVIESRLQIHAAPLALVALDDVKLAGSVSITRDELPHHPDKTFWVGDVIVAADQRGKGIGTLMLRAIVAHAAKIGITDLYLYTPDQENYYRKLGWETIGRDPANGEDNVVMRYCL